MFELIKDYNGNGISLKKGEYSKEELIKLYQDEGRFNYCFACTSLKEVLIPIKKTLKEKVIDKIEEVIETVAQELPESSKTEDQEEVIETVFIVKENLKKGKKVIFEKDDKITYKQLEEAFGEDLESVFDKLIETKVSKNVSI